MITGALICALIWFLPGALFCYGEATSDHPAQMGFQFGPYATRVYDMPHWFKYLFAFLFTPLVLIPLPVTAVGGLLFLFWAFR